MTREPGQHADSALMIIEGGALHAEVLAALHGIAFAAPWSELAFQNLLGLPTVRVWIAGTPNPTGFVVTQTAADEIEILTIAVHSDQRRTGVGRSLVQTALTYAAQHGASTCHLEVAQDNVAATLLYTTLGFKVIGCRPGYYTRPGGAVDAVLMAKKLK